ncbi:hypothetical protein GPALN_005890 [Globodera pallida]|nr:hypothetical protein GPALN_005890 [Globodera pallida]
MFLVEMYKDEQNNEINQKKLLTEVNKIEGLNMSKRTLQRYLKAIEEDDSGKDAGGKDAGGKDAGGEDAGGSRTPISFDQFKNNGLAMSLLLDKLDEDVGLKMCDGTLTKYLKKLKEEAQQNPGFDAPPFPQAPQIAGQSSNFTSGNPGSSTSASNKGKSTNFSKASKKGKSTKSSKKKNSDNLPLSSIPGSAPHYGDAMPSQQAPPMDDTFVPSQAGTDSMNWLGENLQSNDEDLDSVVRPKNTSLFKRALGFVSSLGGASPQEPQFSPSMHDTSAASSYYPSNQPDDQTLESMITSRNPSSMPYQQVPPMPDRFVPSQAGTDSTDWFGLNAQNNVGDLESMIRKPSSSGGVASHYGSAMPSQQAPMDDDTLVPSQVGIDSMNWLGENLQSNDEDLDSVVRPKNTNLFKRALGFMSSLGGASPQEPQFSPSMHDTSAASSYYPSNQPDDQTLQSMITPINQKASHYGAMPHQQDPPMPDRFVPSQAGTDSTDWFGLNAQNNVGDLESMIRNTSSSKGSAPHYGDALLSQQAPPMEDTFVPSHAGTDSMNWLGENLQSNDEDLDSVVRPKNPNLFKRALGFVSSLVGASPQEPQFSPSMHDTAAASSYYPSNQPDDQTLQSMITSRNQKASHYGSAMSYQQVPPVQDTFMPFQAGTDSTNFFGGNWQNNEGTLESMIRKPSSAEGFYGTPYFPNQSQSTGWPGASNYFSPTPNSNPGSSAIPFQQAPMPGTSFPSFPNYPNQSAQLNSSTNFGPFQTETHSWDWSGENSHNITGTLDSVFNTRKRSSSKDKNATKTGKKPRK